MQFLSGYKTYIVAAISALYAGVELWTGQMTFSQAMPYWLASAGAFGLRSGVATEIQNFLKSNSHVLIGLTMVGMVLPLLGACSSTDAVKTDALTAVQTGLTTYADVYQPAVILYGKLPDCGAVVAGTLCKDDALFQKLQAADATATSAITAAQSVLDGSATDSGQLTSAQTAITQAEALDGASGALNQATP